MGCMPLSFPQERDPGLVNDPGRAVAVIHAAMDAGVTLFDTADIYGPSWNRMGHNEELLGRALRSWQGTAQKKAAMVLATKAGITREKNGTMFGLSGRNSSKHYLFRAVEASACRMGLQKIPLWQHHRTDPSLSFEEQFENVLALKEHGYVAAIGLSNVNAAMVRHALRAGGTPAQGGIVSVQNEYSPRYRHWEEVIGICAEHGVAFLPWSPLGGAWYCQNIASKEAGAFAGMAQKKGVSPWALVLAWHLERFPHAIPIPGASQAASILDALTATRVRLSPGEIAELNAALPADAPLHPELTDIASCGGT